jgi:hypothetical protein
VWVLDEPLFTFSMKKEELDGNDLEAPPQYQREDANSRQWTIRCAGMPSSTSDSSFPIPFLVYLDPFL